MNLNAFDKQVFEHLLHAFRIGLHRRRQIRRNMDKEVDALRLGHMAERALQQIVQIREVHFADIEHDRARFDLRQIENIVDERQQIVARRMNRLGVLGLPASEVAVRVLRQLIRQDQQAIERRAQLVRHVRQELRLVLRRERKLLGLFFERLPRLLHFAVLPFHFDVLMREQPGLFLELLIRLLQFLLAILQFHGQRLRLLEQVFRPHVGRDRVEHDADDSR